MLQDHKIKACMGVANNVPVNTGVQITLLAHTHIIDGELSSFKMGGNSATCHGIHDIMLCGISQGKKILFDLILMC